ncbi:MAG TPA: LpqB family beta-propeller domain-containing protein, partial [Terriglobales bacterium]|nr:LpqB family beta-propeller domain-containing protein [Terriglobales bacterium]
KAPSRRKLYAVGATAALILLAGIAYLLRPTLPPPRITGYTQITHDGQQKSFAGQATATVLSDGPRLYIQENINGRFVIAQISASGGETVPIATPFANVTPLNISPDKSELLVGSFTGAEVNQQLWALPVLGGSPRRVSDLPAWDGTWMPNGDFLIARDNQLLEVSPNGTRRLAELPDYSYWFRWSPDGQLMRFTLTDSKKPNSIWELSSSGNLRPVLPDWAGTLHQHGSWTPDGRYFLFQVLRQNRMDLWVIREKGDFFHKIDRHAVQLTSGPMGFNGAQVSADGKKIYAVGEQPRAELVRYDSKSQQFLPYLGGASVTDVSFSPDGQWVAYSTIPEGTLWRSSSDGRQKLQLTSVPRSAGLPRWSPDGKRIAFVSGDSSHSLRLYIVPSEGGTPQQVATMDFDGARPSWLADGNHIVFQDSVGITKSAIKLVDLTTSQVSTLPDSTDMIFPVCSPDGRYIAATSVEGRKLMLFDLSTQKWSELEKMDVGFTDWSKDGKYVYFDTGLSESPAFYRVRVADRKLERIADLKGLRRLVFAWTPWSGVTPDGSPLLLRDTGTQEVYALDLETP